MKMKKKLLHLLMTTLVCLSSLPKNQVHAEQIDVPEVLPYRYTYVSGPGADPNSAPMKRKMYHGRDAYCIEPGVTFSFDNVYQIDDFSRWQGMSESAKETILLASAFGHGYESRQDMIYYCAAQEIIWNVSGTVISWGKDDAVIKQAKSEIEADIRHYQTPLNWKVTDTTDQTVIATGTSINPETVIKRLYHIEETNGVLPYMKNTGHENVELLDESGNVLQDISQRQDFYVKCTKPLIQANINFESPYTNRFQDIPMILFGDGIQDCIACGDIQPHNYQLSLHATDTPYIVQKVNENDEAQINLPLQLKDQNGTILSQWHTTDQPNTLRLKIGQTYTIDEMDAPLGYYCKKFTFTAPDQDFTEQIVPLVNDQKIMYQVLKVDEDKHPVTGAKLALFDVTDEMPKLVEMDQNPWITTSKPKDISSYLKCARSYALVEMDASTNYYLAETMEFNLPQYAPENNTMTTLEVVDNHINYRFAKVDENGQPVANAQISIYDTDDHNREVFHFETGSIPTEIGTLQRGHTYRIVETKTPDGRFTMEEKVFTVPNVHDASPITITGADETIVYYGTKVDENQQPVSDAEMQLYDVTDGQEKLIQTFVTTDQPQRFTGMIVNHTYTLKETKTPQGYYTAEKVTFTIPNHGTSEPVTITAVDHQIDLCLRKTDTDGHPLADITLTVVKKDDETLIGSWQTKPDTDIQIGHLLQAGQTYILKETEWVNGVYKAADIEFTVPNTQPAQPIIITMEDTYIQCEVLKVDEQQHPVANAHLALYHNDEQIHDWITDENPYDISKLVHAGDTYTLRELENPNGYYQADDVTFTVPLTQDESKPQITITMEDQPTRYEIAKIDEKNEYVEGVTLKLIDLTDNKTIEEWVTDTKPKQFNNILITNHTYRLEETEWINGVLQAAAIEFVVPQKQTEPKTIIQMVDLATDIAFVKTDSHGKPIANARLSILDADHNTITTFTSTDDPKGVSTDDAGVEIATLLKGGDTYYLHEEEAPFGFELAEDVAFVMTGSHQMPQLIRMQDVSKTVYLRIRKSDFQKHENTLKGAVYGLFNVKTDEPVLNAEGKQITLTTNEEGIAETTFAFEQDGCYIKEIEAPAGYQLDPEHYAIQLRETTGFTKEKPVYLELYDEEEVKTGSALSVGLIFIVAMMAGVYYWYSNNKMR